MLLPAGKCISTSSSSSIIITMLLHANHGRSEKKKKKTPTSPHRTEPPDNHSSTSWLRGFSAHGRGMSVLFRPVLFLYRFRSNEKLDKALSLSRSFSPFPLRAVVLLMGRRKTFPPKRQKCSSSSSSGHFTSNNRSQPFASWFCRWDVVE